MADLESKLLEWAKPPSEAQEERCSNAESMIRNAIKASPKLAGRNIKVFSQGSYANNTNTARLSDVDVGVVCSDSLFSSYPAGMSRGDFGLSAADYLFSTFKNEVGQALIDYFRDGTVTRGNKAFDIKATSYHVEADVAPFFEHRRYSSSGSYIEGAELRTDNESRRVINWPDQHKENGVAKNNATGRRYKRMVRIVKSINDLTSAPVPGFLLECLLWNVPNQNLTHATYEQSLRATLIFLHDHLDQEASDEWGEVSELKYLFRGNPWSKHEARVAIAAIWSEVGL
ncbi:nucleotidyltransferase domain-containing protein [Roseobacteraceae bacterium S113]